MEDYSLSNQEKTHYTNWWCRSIGIKSRDLEKHPQIDDAILLIRFHQECWFDLNRQERGVWAAYWSYVYHKQFPLKKKHINKLASITEQVISRQQNKSLLRQRIKQISESNKQKRDVHMTANPSLDSELVY
jgi:hypothetical protein